MAAKPVPSAPGRRARRALRHGAALALAVLAAFLIVFLAAAWTLVTRETGVAFIAGELVARSGGALEIDGASGVLVDTVRAKRIVWRGPTATVTATDVALTWRPSMLWSRGIVVEGLGAQRLTIEFEHANGAARALPDDLALPIDVTIERLGVAELHWRFGDADGVVKGLAFGYHGGAAEHRITSLALATAGGAIEGEAKIGAQAPFPVAGRVVYAGDAPRQVRANLSVAGTLSALAVEGKIETALAKGTAHAAIAPLEAVPLRELSADVRDLDLAAWNDALPTTRLAIVARARSDPGGLAGEFKATNTLPGNLDAGRTPVLALSARFAWKADAISFDDIEAELEGGGTGAGRAQVTLAGDGSAVSLVLDVREVDLRRIYSPLVTTRLAGKVSAELGATRRSVSGDLVDRRNAHGLALSVATTIVDRVVNVERFRASAGGATLDAHGRIALDGERALAFEAKATRFDPSRFGTFPAGAIDGRIAGGGVLQPAWRIGGDASIAAGSRLAGVALSGSAHGTFARTFVRDAVVDLRVGSASLAATGSYGGAGDRLTATLDAPHLAELVPLLPSSVPRTAAGDLHVTAESRGAWPQAGIDVVARANALTIGPTLAVGALSARVALAPASVAEADATFAARALSVAIDAKDAVAPFGKLATAHGTISGSLAQHAIEVALRGDDIDLDAKAHGGLRDGGSADLSRMSWSGMLDAFANRGSWPARLAAPTTLSFAPGRFRLGEAQIEVADGSLNLGEFAWDNGKIATRGSIKAVPAATLARFAGKELPFASTVTLGGDWSLAATPRLSGTVTLHRESGDLRLAPTATTGTQSSAAGITTLAIAARFSDDAVDATATFRSTRAGSADAKLAIGTAALATPGRISADAPMELTIHADLPTLQPLQPWVGTAVVVDGRARVDVTAKGTLRTAPLSGTLEGDALRVDAPRYGLHFVDGRVSARFAGRNLVLEELSLNAGTGTFRASGTVDAPIEGSRSPTAHLAWHAERFRVFNRPDLHLVVSGEGSVASEDRKVALKGKLRADEGRIAYDTEPTATLGDDVVVIGWPRKTAATQPGADIPLALDLDLDFGDQLRFSGRGLETRLAGNIRVASGPAGFTGKGSIRAVNGTYFAYGQRLVIDPGRLLFDGPLDNPGLDIVALRKNLAVEAGVVVTGTVKVPIVALTSRPPVPDADKLAWLVLGHGLDRTGGNDVAALQAASAALLGPNAKPVTQTIAQRFGLDEISFKSAQGTARGTGQPDAEGQVVTVGKRLSENLAIVYEQGLTVATNALRLEYNLTGSLTLRAEAGTVSGFGLYYRRTFE